MDLGKGYLASGEDGTLVMRWDMKSWDIMATNSYCPPVISQKLEKEAEEFAAYFLMPEKELQKLKSKTSREIANYFGVPEEMVDFRLKLSRTGE